jgi:hypothetical protein
MATRITREHRGGPAARSGSGIWARRPVLVHHVVVRDGEKGLEVLRIPQHGKGEALAVFSAGWAARGYLFAEAPGGDWYVKACTPGELLSLLGGPCAGVEWVALDPRPGRGSGGEAANVMPRENFLDYLLAARTGNGRTLGERHSRAPGRGSPPRGPGLAAGLGPSRDRARSP